MNKNMQPNWYQIVNYWAKLDEIDQMIAVLR